MSSLCELHAHSSLKFCHLYIYINIHTHKRAYTHQYIKHAHKIQVHFFSKIIISVMIILLKEEKMEYYAGAFTIIVIV